MAVVAPWWWRVAAVPHSATMVLHCVLWRHALLLHRARRWGATAAWRCGARWVSTGWHCGLPCSSTRLTAHRVVPRLRSWHDGTNRHGTALSPCPTVACLAVLMPLPYRAGGLAIYSTQVALAIGIRIVYFDLSKLTWVFFSRKGASLSSVKKTLGWHLAKKTLKKFQIKIWKPKWIQIKKILTTKLYNFSRSTTFILLLSSFDKVKINLFTNFTSLL
jgi:hypothetical protein